MPRTSTPVCVTTPFSRKQAAIDAQRIMRTYYGIAATTTLAQALIWGVNALFLLSVGFDIFQVMLINAAYTVAQVIFEVPTGVVADTVAAASPICSPLPRSWCPRCSTSASDWPATACGCSPPPRRCSASATRSTPAPWTRGWWTLCSRWGTRAGWSRSSPATASRSASSLLIGTTLGGVLGQVDLWIPYVARAVILVPAFLLELLVMRDLGFKPRALTLGSFGHETRRIAREGVTYGLQQPGGALHHVRLAGAGRVLHVRLLLVAEVLPGPARQRSRLGHRRDRRPRRAHADLRQHAGRTYHGARPGPRPHPHGVRRGHHGDGDRRGACAAVLGAAVPLYLVSTIAFGVSVPVSRAG